MVVVYWKILQLLEAIQVDKNIAFEILMLLDVNNAVHFEIFMLIINFVTNYEEDILEAVRLICMMQIVEHITIE